MWDLNLHLPYYSPLFTGTRHSSRLRKKWAAATDAANLTISTSGRKVLTPKLSQISIASDDGQQVSAIVDMSTVGHTSKELAARIETVTSVLGGYQAKVERLTPATSRITISFSPPRRPQPLSHQQTSNLGLDLEQFPVSLDPTTEASLLLTKSILIGGESESGKSNLVWYILSQLNTYHIPYRLWVIDPAGGVELADLETSPLTRQYVDRVRDIQPLTEKFRDSMDRRLTVMKQRGVRRHIPTHQEPVEICIVDELLLCKNQLKADDVNAPLGEVLTAGRKALHLVIGCSQLSQKETIGQIRDLFPQRICLRTKSQDITDAVLGTNATTDGAVCHRITARGEGYVFTDTSQVFEKFHAPLVRETQSIAQGGVTVPNTPPPQTRGEKLRQRRQGRTFLYQFYDQQSPNHPEYRRPAYVGITHNPKQRFKKHEQDFPEAIWQSFIHARTRITAYSTWDEAKEMETRLIDYWQPKYNIQERRTA